MVRPVSSKKHSPARSVFRWFLVGFLSFSLIFCVALLPLISYCRGVFTELEIKKSTQQMDFGINQLENAFTTVANASRSIYDDSRFYALHYANTDYSEISAVVCNQMKDYLGSLMRPCDLIVDSALQLSGDDAVTPLVTTFGGWAGYYPFYFRIDDPIPIGIEMHLPDQLFQTIKSASLYIIHQKNCITHISFCQ